MSAVTRFIGISGLLGASGAAAALVVGRSYGGEAGRRCAGTTLPLIAAQQVAVGVGIRQTDGTRHSLSLVDSLTLSRGATAALLVGLVGSGVRDRRGPAGWLSWLSILYAAILCDWLDGPLARHTRTSTLGAVFDLEADSWLTLATASAAATWGGLPRVVILAPILRYVLLADALRHHRYSEIFDDESAWGRRLGIAQMLLFIGALAPFGGRITRRVVWIMGPLLSPLLVSALLLLHRARFNAQ